MCTAPLGLRAVLLVSLVFLPPSLLGAPSPPQSTTKPRLSVEERLLQLEAEIRRLRAERAVEQAATKKEQAEFSTLAKKVDGLADSPLFDTEKWFNKLRLGGYGEMHANFGESDTPDQFDLHRLVLYTGYDFTDWLRFESETEIEHAFVTTGSGGMLVMEQAYIEAKLSKLVSLRAGRVLAPLGIVNKKHEPTAFNGVERPAFAKYIIPSTWSVDGIGLFGEILPSLKYEVYVVGGLDGSMFNAKDGIRKGRIKERPSIHDVALTGRVDWYPFLEALAARGQTLRLGASGYFGGADNGNRGKNNGINSQVRIGSADFEYTVGRFDFRGVVAVEEIIGARKIGNGTAKTILGYYVEGAYHCWPEGWKKGKLEKADAVAFIRFDDFDTQYKMPSGRPRNPAGDRQEWTFGVGFFPVPNFVVKADYQIVDDRTSQNLANKINLSLGWAF